MSDLDPQVKCIKCASHIRRMSKIDRFEIVLATGDRIRDGVYFLPGDMLEGTVYLDINERMKIKDITIKWEGKCSVLWKDFTGLRNYTDRLVYSADEVYMGEQHTLLSPHADRKLMILEAGSYQFPFKLKLSEDIPGSFIHKNGIVHYNLYCSINKRWGKKDKESRLFFVAQFGALDSVPEAKVPVTVDKCKTVGCFCRGGDPINATLRLNRRGYIPGDDVIVDAEIDNTSSSAIKSVTVRLIEAVRFSTWGIDYKKEEILLDEVTRGPIAPSEPCSLEGVKLQIPDHHNLPVTGFPGCRLINVEYYVELEIDITKTTFSLKLSAPFVLGTEAVTSGTVT